MEPDLSVNVRFAEPRDLDYCIKSDYKHVGEAQVKKKIEEKAIVIADVEGKPHGYLRIEYLWLRIPYISVIGVDEEYRRRGVGTAMINFLENHMRKGGHKALYSSSQADEPEPQMWHRRIGFEECGFIAGINEGEIGEIFFGKVLEK